MILFNLYIEGKDMTWECEARQTISLLKNATTFGSIHRCGVYLNIHACPRIVTGPSVCVAS